MNPVIGIIGGKGRMGQLFASFFEEKGIKVLISDTKTKLTSEELARKSDITIVSVPIDKTEEVIKKIVQHVPTHSALMDLTSVKEMPLRAMKGGLCEVTGLHPMFGDSNPIKGQTVIFCPTAASGKWTNWLKDFLEENGAKTLIMTAKEHDKTMSIAQGMIHFADITFADAIRRTKKDIKELVIDASKASELKILLATRLIAQDSNLYANIQIQNPQTLTALSYYQSSIKELVKIVEKKDVKAFMRYFEKNQKYYKSYLKEAYGDSSILIDKLIEIHQSKGKKAAARKPKKTDVATLGPANTFSHIAAQKLFPNQNLYFAHDLDEIFELTEKGSVAAGVVPIENKLHGTIRETLDGLFYKNVHITAEQSLAINHCLVTHAHASKKDIKKIISHSQALNQCKKYIKKHFPKAEVISTPSTAAAVAQLLNANDKSVAAIATELSAQANNLKILAKGVQDIKENATTFLVIEQKSSTTKGVDSRVGKTSIAFYFKADSPGSLFTVFQDFAQAKINMTKVESRPTQATFGEYIFYIDFDGHLEDKNVAQTLKKVTKKVAHLKILGSY